MATATAPTMSRPSTRVRYSRSASAPPSVNPTMPENPYTAAATQPALNGVILWKRMMNGDTKAPSAYMLKLCSAPDTMIQSSVGIDSTSRYGFPSRRRSPIACVSTVPRFGSRMRSAAIAQRTPGTAAT